MEDSSLRMHLGCSKALTQNSKLRVPCLGMSVHKGTLCGLD